MEVYLLFNHRKLTILNKVIFCACFIVSALNFLPLSNFTSNKSGQYLMNIKANNN